MPKTREAKGGGLKARKEGSNASCLKKKERNAGARYASDGSPVDLKNNNMISIFLALSLS